MFDLQQYVDDVLNTNSLIATGLGDNMDVAFCEFANLNREAILLLE